MEFFDWEYYLNFRARIPTNLKLSKLKKTRLFNLYKDYCYQSKGYYVSLLAEAREHRIISTVTNIVDLRDLKFVRIVLDEFDDAMQQNLKTNKSREFTLRIYFGQNVAQRYKGWVVCFTNTFKLLF